MSKKIVLVPGRLPGYHTSDSDKTRHGALLDASRKDGKIDQSKLKTVKKRLTVLETFTKRTQPKNSRVYKRDKKYVDTKIKKK